MRQKSMLTRIFNSKSVFSGVVVAILLKIQKLQLKILTNDCRVMLNSSSKFKSLGEREDFLSSVSKVLLQQKLFQEKVKPSN